MLINNRPQVIFDRQFRYLLKSIVYLVCALISSIVVAQSNVKQLREPFRLMQLEVPAGERISGRLPVNGGADGVDTFIPVTVFHGRDSGPVLSLIAGIHGSEYSPIISMQRLPELLDPQAMSGTLIIVHIANLPAFQGRSIYFGPDDLKNLNRSFPGKADGTVTERIAFTLSEEIMPLSDYLIDIHSGDGNESLRPSYSAYYAEAGGTEVVNQSRRLAVAFGLETIVQFAGSYSSLYDAIYTSAQSVMRGIPSIDVESGELGIIDDVFIDPITDGALSVLRELGMVEGEPIMPANPLFISDRARVYSEYDGLWFKNALVKTGDYVTKGTELGIITDYFGKELQKVVAPASGVLLILFGTPPVNMDDNNWQGAARYFWPGQCAVKAEHRLQWSSSRLRKAVPSMYQVTFSFGFILSAFKLGLPRCIHFCANQSASTVSWMNSCVSRTFATHVDSYNMSIKLYASPLDALSDLISDVPSELNRG